MNVFKFSLYVLMSFCHILCEIVLHLVILCVSFRQNLQYDASLIELFGWSVRFPATSQYRRCKWLQFRGVRQYALATTIRNWICQYDWLILLVESVDALPTSFPLLLVMQHGSFRLMIFVQFVEIFLRMAAPVVLPPYSCSRIVKTFIELMSLGSQ